MNNPEARARAKKGFEGLQTRKLLEEFDEVALFEKIREQVVGQDVLAGLVASKICDAGILGDSSKPRCSLLISGMPGVGKSHFAKTVARAVYGKQAKPFELVNCGEILDRHSFDLLMFGTASRNVGASKSPIGEYLHKYPKGGVIIFDEIEKALHAVGSQATSVFLGIMEEGKLSDADKRHTYDLSNHIVIFTSNEKQEEMTQVADQLLPDMQIEIAETEHGKRLVLPSNADEITNQAKEVLLRDSCFDGAFLRRLDFVSSVKTLNEDEALMLGEVLFFKYCEGKATEIKGFDDTFEGVFVDQFIPWFAHKISDIGQAQAEKELERIFQSDRTSIVKARKLSGKDREFTAQLVFERGRPWLKDAEVD